MSRVPGMANFGLRVFWDPQLWSPKFETWWQSGSPGDVSGVLSLGTGWVGRDERGTFRCRYDATRTGPPLPPPGYSTGHHLPQARAPGLSPLNRDDRFETARSCHNQPGTRCRVSNRSRAPFPGRSVPLRIEDTPPTVAFADSGRSSFTSLVFLHQHGCHHKCPSFIRLRRRDHELDKKPGKCGT